MKTRFKNPFLLAVLLVFFGSRLLSRAQTFTTLHSFTEFNGSHGLIVYGGKLYGTTSLGGALNAGTVFTMNPDGRDYSIVHSFSGGEGAAPACDLIRSGDTLYGTTIGGCSFGAGTVFSMNTNGTAFATLHSFNSSTGFG